MLRLPRPRGDHGHGTFRAPEVLCQRRSVAGVFRCPTSGWNVPGRAPPGRRQTDWEAGMLWTIFVILLVLWLLGMVSSYTLGGFIHVLLVVAIVIALIQLIQGRRVV